MLLEVFLHVETHSPLASLFPRYRITTDKAITAPMSFAYSSRTFK
jgi:hypothetical protein